MEMEWVNTSKTVSNPNETSEPDNTVSYNWWWLFIKRDTGILFGTISFIGNALIVTVILKYPSLRKQEEFIPIIGFLGAADGITGFGALMDNAFQIWKSIIDQSPCTRGEALGFRAPVICGSALSQGMIAFIGLDRLRAIRDPLEYTATNQFKFASRAFLGTAVFSLLTTVAMFTGDLSMQPQHCGLAATASEAYMNYIGGMSILIALIIIVIYFAILITMREKTKSAVNGGESVVAAQLERQARVTRTISLILGLYCVLWAAPTLVYAASRVIGSTSTRFTKIMIDILGIGTAASSASNIFVYSYKVPGFRLYLKKFFKGDKENSIVPAH